VACRLHVNNEVAGALSLAGVVAQPLNLENRSPISGWLWCSLRQPGAV